MNKQNNPFKEDKKIIVNEKEQNTQSVVQDTQSVINKNNLVSETMANKSVITPDTSVISIHGQVVPMQNQVPMQGQIIPSQSIGVENSTSSMDAVVTDVSMDDDIKINKLERFPKLAKGEVARVAFILFDANKAPLLKMSHVYYYKPAEMSFVAPRNKDTLSKVVDKIGEPSPKFGAVILRYTTDKAGNVYPNWGLDLFAFIFATDKFPTLKSLHKEWGLSEHDIILTCSDHQYQKMSITLARECLWKTLPQETINAIIAKAQELQDKQLPKQFGKILSDQEILITLGIIQAPTPVGAGGAGVYNPFPAGGQAVGGVMVPGQMVPGQMVPAGGNFNPAANLANQVGQGIPAGGNFSHLIKK